MTAGLVIIVLAGCATGGRVTGTWKAQDLVDQPESNVRLLRKDSKTVAATVNREQIAEMLATEARIERAAGIRAEVLIVDTKEPNAFATTKGGQNYIGITLPMLTVLGTDQTQYAALFGHETGHLVKGHMEATQTRIAVIQVLQVAAGIALGAVGAPFGSGYAVDLAAAAISTKFSRDQEREADALSVVYMSSAGFDPQGAVRLQQTLLAASGSSSFPFLSDHPTGEERIKNIQAMIDQRGNRPGSSAPAASSVGSPGNDRISSPSAYGRNPPPSVPIRTIDPTSGVQTSGRR